MAKQLRTLGTTVFARPGMADLVGQPEHVRQIAAYANVTSKVEFARLLVAYGLGDRGSVNMTVRNILGWNLAEPNFIEALEPGVLYIGRLMGSWDDLIPAPAKKG